MKHVIVIGGGIVGLSAAYYLQRSGHSVTVIDKGDFTNNCSYGNAGYVCPSHFIPLAAPGMVRKGLKWMFNPQSPFYIQPSLNRSLIDWGVKFARSANAGHVRRAAIPLRDIALLSQKEYEKWAATPGFDFSYEHKGLLEIFRTGAVADHAQHIVQQAQSLGLEASLLDAETLQQMEPDTAINALGAILFGCDAHLYPNKLMQGLLSRLKQSGIRLVSGATVTGFEKNGASIKKVLTPNADYDAETVVIAAGAWSREIAAMVNTKIPLMPGRGYSLTLENAPYRLHHPAVLAEGRVAITPMDGNKIRFGGTMEVVPIHTPPRYQRVQGILNAVKRFFPEFTLSMPAPEKLWYGFRPCSADGLPYIGKIKHYNNVVIATGHSMLGLSLGAGTGKLVSEVINGEKSSISLAPFAVERFG